MSDEYLWNKSGPPDPEVERLERLLARYRYSPEPEPREALSTPYTFRRVLLLSAALAAAVLIAWVLFVREVPSYRVRGLEGREVVRAGDEITTGAGESAEVVIGGLGQVEMDPNTRLRVEDCGASAHRLFLAQGSVKARILAQPRLFQIGTPAGRAVDLGCAYNLSVNDGGESELRVTTGQVAFEFDGREVYVPSGAGCTSAPGRGPSVPVFEHARTEFKDALAVLEWGKGFDEKALSVLFETGEFEDTLTLWHLFDAGSVPVEMKQEIFAFLSRRFPKPQSVTDEGLLAGDRKMRAAWMETMKSAWRVGD